MFPRPFQLALRFACRHSHHQQRHLRTLSTTRTSSTTYPLDSNQTITEGPSWVIITPQHVSQTPRDRSQQLRAIGQYREAHSVLRKAGVLHSHNEHDLIEFLLVLQHTDEFSGPHQRLNAMLDVIWAAPIRKPKKAFRILLNACSYEAANVSDNAVVKLAAVEGATEIAWRELRHFGGKNHSNPVDVDSSTIALIYRICGYCRALNLANRVRDDVDDPIIEINDKNGMNSSSEDAIAEYILCLGKCGKPVDAERLFFSHHNRMFRASPRVLASLFQAYLAVSRISKAEALISVHGASFLDLSSCNAFIKQCSSLRLFETSLIFLDRMERFKETGFPAPAARTYNILLHGLSATHAGADDNFEETANDVLSRMRENAIEPTNVTYNTLIRSYVMRGKMNDAMILFRSMENPDRITFSHLMQGVANAGDADIAKDLLIALKRFKERPTYGLCKSYLHVMAAVHGADYAYEQAHELVNTFSNVLVFGDVGPEEAVRMALIHACGKIGNLPAAFRALSAKIGDVNSDGGPLAPLYVATVLMQACLDCGREGQALEVFESLKSSGLNANYEVYESLIKGLCNFIRESTQRQYVHNESNDDWTSNDRMYDEFTGDDEVFEVFNETLRLVREMHDRGAARTTRQATFMYNLLITAAAGLGKFDVAFEIFRRMPRHSNGKASHKSRSDNVGRIDVRDGEEMTDDDIRKEWDELKGCDNLPPTTVSTYNSIMAAARRCARAKEAVIIFDRMQMDRETEPTEATFGLLADIGLECDDVEVVQKILLELDRVRLPERVSKKRVRLRQKILSVKWSKRD